MLAEYSQLAAFVPHPNAQSSSKKLTIAGEANPSSVVLGLRISPFGAGLSGSPCTRPSPGMQLLPVGSAADGMQPGKLPGGAPTNTELSRPSNHKRLIWMLFATGLTRPASAMAFRSP